jgi:hypothetical protein
MAREGSGLGVLGFIVGALVVWLATYTGALMALNRDPASPTLRGAIVAVGVLGFIPWVIASARAIRAQDEFTERVHLVALASAFAVTALFVFACDFLQRARFVGYVPLSTVWMTMILTWAASIVVASRYYR